MELQISINILNLDNMHQDESDCLAQPFSSSKKIQTYKSKIQIGLIVWNITLASFYFGYCLVYLGTIPIETTMTVFQIDFDKGVLQGILNGCVPIGALTGALISSIVIACFSRRNCFLFINSIAFVVGGLLYIPNVYTLIIFRIIQGICVGIFSALAPLVVKEISPTQISGTLGTFSQLNISFGILLAYLFNYCLKKIMNDLTCQSFWHLTFGIPFTTLILQTMLLLFVFPYQTPKYLLLQGRQEQAKKLIQKLYRPQYVEEVLEQKKKDIESLKKINVSIVSEPIQSEADTLKFNNKKNSKITIIMGLHLAVMQQLSGVNAINLYCNPIVNKAVTGELALLMSSFITLQKLLTTFVLSYILTRFGRKTILQMGGFCQGCACAMIAVGFYIHQSNPQISDKLIIVGLFFFMGVYGMSIGPVVWLYTAEIVQPKIIPFTTAANWITSTSVVIFFPIITDNLLSGNPAFLFVFFSCYQFAAFIQTKGKTEKQIRDDYFGISQR